MVAIPQGGLKFGRSAIVRRLVICGHRRTLRRRGGAHLAKKLAAGTDRAGEW
jgi:hypothetical protein